MDPQAELHVAKSVASHIVSAGNSEEFVSASPKQREAMVMDHLTEVIRKNKEITDRLQTDPLAMRAFRNYLLTIL